MTPSLTTNEHGELICHCGRPFAAGVAYGPPAGMLPPAHPGWTEHRGWTAYAAGAYIDVTAGPTSGVGVLAPLCQCAKPFDLCDCPSLDTVVVRRDTDAAS